MHYAEFAADEVGRPSQISCGGMRAELTKSVQEAALLNAIKEYEANKWKVIGQKVGKPAKVCITSKLLQLGRQRVWRFLTSPKPPCEVMKNVHTARDTL